MEQLKDFSEEQIKAVAQEVLDKGFVYYTDQDLTKTEYVDLCRMFGDTNDPQMGSRPEGKYWCNPDEAPDISFVTGELDDKGRAKGLFGYAELNWHSNGSICHIDEFDEYVVALYCVQECPDTVLSVGNLRDPFAELSEEQKNYWRSFQVQHNPRGRYTIEWDKDDPNDLHTMYGMESNFTYPVDHKSTNERMPLVNVHPQDGKEFIFYQYVYFDKLWKDGVELTPEQRDEVEQELQDLVVRSRFIDNFVFRKGDLLIMDQLYTMHRRSPIRDTNRLLWRTAFDYQNIKW